MGLQESKDLSNDSTIAYEGRSSVGRSSQSKKTNAFTLAKQVYDIRYGGNVKIVRRSQNTRDYVQIKKTLDSQLALERELRSLNRRIFSPHPNQLRVDCYTQHETYSCCSLQYHINIHVEYLDRDLEQELNEKQQTLILFMEYELIFLIENLCMGLNHFEKSHNPYRDVRPSNILIDSFGVYKYIDHELVDLEHKASLEKTQKRLLAPEILSSNLKDRLIDPHKADVFSLGMTILQAATLEPSCELYDYKKREINVKQLDIRLNKISETYSLGLSMLITSMLTMDPKERPKIEKVCEQLAELGDSLVGNGAAQSYVLDRVHANQGASTNNLSLDIEIIDSAEGRGTATKRTSVQRDTKVIL